MGGAAAALSMIVIHTPHLCRCAQGRWPRAGSPAPVLCWLLLLLSASTTRAAVVSHQPTRGARLVVFVLDRTRIQDVLQAHAPAMQSLMRSGAVGLMNTASASGRSPQGAHITLSAGAHAAATPQAGECMSAIEPWEGDTAREVFLRRTGRSVGPHTVLALGLAAILRANEERATGASAGALGDMLSTMGRTACIGCPDAPGPYPLPERYAPIIAMRRSGVLDAGDVSRALLMRDPTAPFGVSTDPQRLLAAFTAASSSCATMVVDLGETARAEAYRPWLAPAVVPAIRRAAIERADRLVASLLPHIDRNAIVLLISPFPPVSPQDRVESPGFLVVHGMGAGLLTSGTTRTPGFIANIDLLPTLASLLRLRPPNGVLLTGSAAHVLPQRLGPEVAAALADRIELEREMAASPFLGVIAVLAALMAIGASVAAVWRHLAPTGRAPTSAAAHAMLGYAALAPLAVVVAPVAQWCGVASQPAYWLFALLLWFAIGVPALIWPRRALKYAVWTTALVISAACLLGALRPASTGVLGPWPLALSVLDDFAIVGVRFHGLSNELMGVLVASLLLILCLGVPSGVGRARSVALWGTALAAALFIGAPALGDNAGGAAAAVFGLGAAALVLTGKRIRPIALLALAALTAAVLAGLSALDSASPAPTHIGRTAILMRQMGPGYALVVAGRKALLNLSMAIDPRALWFYAALAAVVALWTTAVPDVLRQALGKRTDLRRCAVSSLVGAAAAFAFNDTGIIPAALIVAGLVLAVADALLEGASQRPGSL